MNTVISSEEVRKAIKVDFDYDPEEIDRLAEAASSYLIRKTGYDFGKEDTVEPLALEAATSYVKMRFFSSDRYNKDFDFSMGLSGLLVELQVIANEKLEAEAALAAEEV